MSTKDGCDQNTHSSLTMGPGLPHKTAAWPGSKSPQRQPVGNYIAFYDLTLEDMEGHCSHIVVTGVESLRPAYIQEGNQDPPQ